MFPTIPPGATATPTPAPTNTPFINPTSLPGMFPAARFADISTLTNIISPLLTIGAALLFGVMMLRAAYLWLSAGDDMEKIAEAKRIMTYAIVGIIIIVSAYTLVKLIGFIFKVEIPL
jgi:hypothetical protein